MNTAKGKKPDMTPLVDLGFLLITFFIYTTTFTKANVMRFATPKQSEKNTSPIKNSNSLTVLLGENDRLYWYQKPLSDLNSTDFHSSDYSAWGIRKVLTEKRNEAKNPEHFTVILKATDKATWKNTVDMLDELAIVGGMKSALVDLSPKELSLYQSITQN